MDYKPRETEIKFLRGIGEYRSKLFSNLGIHLVNDLFEYFPKDYIKREVNSTIRHLQIGQFVSMKVTVFSVNEATTKSGKKQLKVLVSDGDRMMECTWFTFGKWVTKYTVPGKVIRVNGQVSEYLGNLQLVQPQIEEEKEELTNDFWTVRPVLPIYKLTGGLTQNILRNAIYNAFALYHQGIDETLPENLIKKYGFLDRKSALQKMHFSSTPEDIIRVKSRFVYEEFFYLQLMVAKNSRLREDVEKERRHFRSWEWGVGSGELRTPTLPPTPNSPLPIPNPPLPTPNSPLPIPNPPLPTPNSPLPTPNSPLQKLKNSLPFTLTNAQKRVINEIFRDMTSPKPMSRMLQGDVGAGKTIVTVFALLLAIENGYQTALIAPTEILAEQHYNTISRLLKDIEGINICLIKGGVNKQKKIDKNSIIDGTINLAIGTHALFQKDVKFKNLSFIVIDEQHRFGVAQRAELSQRHNYPDLLYLSATPIPRSLAMTAFGEMTISSIDELPPTRKPVKTLLVYNNQKPEVYEHLKTELAEGRQIYIVCPLIEESEKVDLQDAESLYDEITHNIFPEYSAKLLHGQLKAKEKEEIMSSFASGETKILVSTTVIEVGIDVANASVMVIEHAERFGLATLHQLRGRVGRGADQSYCYLIAYAMSEIGRERLRTMVKTNDGFMIAEKDLELRGAGDMFGTIQSGLPEFKFANIVTDIYWLNTARQDAFFIIDDDPNLEKPENEFIRNYYDNYVVKKENLSKF